mmetsp:Transcript_37050/g.56818  ORF Transcript_37050/g.56818 Transcript_37050/m.56818 type:complete len:106 (+) Transcript_37050:18-335(+)
MEMDQNIEEDDQEMQNLNTYLYTRPSNKPNKKNGCAQNDEDDEDASFSDEEDRKEYIGSCKDGKQQDPSKTSTNAKTAVSSSGTTSGASGISGVSAQSAKQAPGS